MPRLLLALVLTAAPLRAADPAPERLLSPSTKVYVRWDGITPHKAAYQASVWGGTMQGPTGETLYKLLDKLPRLLGAEMLGQPLLEGRPIKELRTLQADVKLVSRLPKLIADRGVLFAVEVEGPRAALGDVVNSVGGASAS